MTEKHAPNVQEQAPQSPRAPLPVPPIAIPASTAAATRSGNPLSVGDEMQRKLTDATTQIINGLFAGVTVAETLRATIGEHCRAYWWEWLNAEGNESLRKLYDRARDACADAFADQVLAVADTAVDGDTASAARVRADARKWLASRLAPSRYGDAPPSVGNGGQIVIQLGRFGDSRD
jgi:hypothetical protein